MIRLRLVESNILLFYLYFQQVSIVSSTTSRCAVLIEEANDLPRYVFPPCLLVVHDTRRGRENDVAELTGRKQLDDPLLEIGDADIITGRNHAGLVDTMESRNSAALQISIHMWQTLRKTHRPLSWITILPER